MTKRLKEGYPPDPHGWYRETPASVEQLADALDFGDALIWDPSCGGGNILDVFKRRGHPTIGSDIIDRSPRHPFYRGNFLKLTRWPTPPDGRALSIVCNPPYNMPSKGIAEEFIHRTLEMIPFHRAAFLVPIEFQCGQTRYRDLFSKKRPSHVASLSERPSMPPGEAVSALGDRAYEGGMADYCWIVWTSGGPWRTEHLFLAPSDTPAPPSPRRKRDGSRLPSVSAHS